MKKKSSLVVKEIQLARWFPAHDPVAAAVARLCILREDFYLEALAFGTDSIPALDTNGEVWRRIYFLRQSIRTIHEARRALMILNQDKAFKAALKNEGAAFRRAIQDFERKVENANIKSVRNAVGGHILHEEVEALLDRLESTDMALAIFGSTHSNTHYKFAADLAWNIMFNDIPEDRRSERTMEILGVILSGLLDAVDRVLTAYAASRRLV